MSVVKRNIVWLLLSQTSTWLLRIFILIVVPSELGAADFGEMNFAVVYVGFFGLIAIFGTGDYLTKEIARNPHQLGHFLRSTLALKAMVSVALAVLALAIGLALDFSPLRMTLIAIASIGMVLDALNNSLVGGLQGLERMGGPAFWNAVRLYVGAAVGLVVLSAGGGVTWYMLAFELAAIIPFVANRWAIRSQLRTGQRTDRRVWRQVTVGGSPFFVMSALIIVYGQIDIPMISAFSGSETVGWYALAYKWASMPALFAAAVSQAFLPALSVEGVRDPNRFAEMANRALHVVMLVAAPAALGIGLIAGDFVATVYGSAFAEAVPLIRILAISVPIVAFDIILGMVAVSADRQRRLVIFGLCAAVLNPLVNLVAIPLTERWYGNGAIGAAFTTVLTEFVLLGGLIAIRPAGVLDQRTQRLILKIAAASTTIIPVVLVLGSAHIVVQVTAGALAYAAASFALRTISLGEIRDLARRPSRQPGSQPTDYDDSVTARATSPAG